MTYDELFEAIQEKYENGEYSYEEAELMNELAYEKFGDAEDEDLTMEEVCDNINTYIEKMNEQRNPTQRLAKITGSSETGKLHKMYSNSDEHGRTKRLKNDTADAFQRFRDTEKEVDDKFAAYDPAIDKNSRTARHLVAKYNSAGNDYTNAIRDYNDSKKVSDTHKNIGKSAKDKIRADVDAKYGNSDRVAALHRKKFFQSKEAAETMLNVYRAFDEGVISEEEKDIFLSALE